MGFGVGIAMGPATVGTVGYEGRLDYTAIGNVINLASRLCGWRLTRKSWWIPVVAEKVKDRFALVTLGKRTIKGYDHPLRGLCRGALALADPASRSSVPSRARAPRRGWVRQSDVGACGNGRRLSSILAQQTARDA